MISFLSWVINQPDKATRPSAKMEDIDEEARRRREGDAKLLEDFDAGRIKKEPTSAEPLQAAELPSETLVFVDADGVINVGIRDQPGQSPLLLCETNLARCKLGTNPRGPSAIIRSVANREIGHGDDGSYAKFATPPGSFDISPILGQRLGRIIDAAGPRCTMVLSSSWRKPSHRPRVEALEAKISEHCGRALKFNEKTAPGGDEPDKRLLLIGNFVRDWSSKRRDRGDDGPLRVLVIDDFAATHPSRWKTSDLNSVSDVEELLRKRSVCPENTFVKLVHTYEEWCTEAGAEVQIGCGLTTKKVQEAERFLMGEVAGAPTD